MHTAQVQNLEHRSWDTAAITHMPDMSIIILNVRLSNLTLKKGNNFTKTKIAISKFPIAAHLLSEFCNRCCFSAH